ncbi:hypothetical protein DPMN_104675 [Dreissena polymorpha]|uniref:Uncharacterized protein n=1 Tax=Dreissena polymorpha TaxID=45954 RepID=A0A9D4K344_DREPO|nr:hypothetical protein DPMN_104675 [Dreissena polymorpha]
MSVNKKTASFIWGPIHEDLIQNVASRVLTRKTDTPLAAMFLQLARTIFNLDRDIIHANTKNVTSVVDHIKKTALPPGGHVFQLNITIFELCWNMIRTNVLTMFNYSFIKRTAATLGSHVFQQTRTIFKLGPDIIQTNIVSNLHEDWSITRFHYSHIKKTGLPPGDKKIAFPLDWTNKSTALRGVSIVVCQTSKVFTRLHNSHTMKTAPPPGGHNRPEPFPNLAMLSQEQMFRLNVRKMKAKN